MITQCEIRKLYADRADPAVREAIELAKTFERRRCGHHPDEYPEPLPTEECLLSIVDPKGSGQNKHRYVVACQDQDLRRLLRTVRGTPLIYIKRSVMILEPMADDSAQVRAREERIKFRAEIKSAIGKRKRGAGEDEDGSDKDGDGPSIPGKEGEQQGQKKKKAKGKGPKGPNPLSMKKAKKPTQDPAAQNKAQKPKAEQEADAPAKRKRRRKSKAKGEGTAEGAADGSLATESKAADSD